MRPRIDGVLEAALYADDLGAAEQFYRDILGLPVITRKEGRHVFFRAGETIVLVFRAAATRQPPEANAPLPVPPHGSDGEGHLCFRARAAALDAWVAHLRDAGIEIEADFRWPNGARSIYVRDPAGNSVEFAEAALWPSG